jgi:chromosome segregation ATPase
MVVMLCSKVLVRSLVIAAAVGGTGLLIAGPERVGAVTTQARNSINSAIDKQIGDPVALRAQLRSLMEQYPAKIADVRGDLAELQAQSSQLKRDLEVSQRVVALANNDFGQMQTMIARAEAAQGSVNGAVVQVVFDNQPLNLEEAYGKANHITEVREAYTARVTDIERDMGYLGQQETRLTELLGQLEREQTEFQGQVLQLDRQIDAIARNDRMIDVMQKREATIAEHSRYKAHSLDQLQTRLADLRAKQEAQLNSLGKSQSQANYESRAKFELDARSRYQSTVNKPAGEIRVRQPVIQITPENAGETTTPAELKPGASSASAAK